MQQRNWKLVNTQFDPPIESTISDPSALGIPQEKLTELYDSQEGIEIGPKVMLIPPDPAREIAEVLDRAEKSVIIERIKALIVLQISPLTYNWVSEDELNINETELNQIADGIYSIFTASEMNNGDLFIVWWLKDKLQVSEHILSCLANRYHGKSIEEFDYRSDKSLWSVEFDGVPWTGFCSPSWTIDQLVNQMFENLDDRFMKEQDKTALEESPF